MSDHLNRLERFLSSQGQAGEITQLTADASTREYFRIDWKGQTAVACLYTGSFVAAEHSYLDVTKLFLEADLPVARIYAFDESLGVIIQEDLGDRVLRDVLATVESERENRLRREGISLIARIQLATERAFESGSIASKLKFDKEKLLWELMYFKEHYFSTFLKAPLNAKTEHALEGEFIELAETLEGFASVLCHRDFHAANLMLDHEGRMRIIDHQDARIGSPAYDLVSFLLDRITVPPPPEWLAAQRKYFLNVRTTLGLPKLDEQEFAYEFRLQTLQRCLKAVGTFSYQSSMRGKTYFIPFIMPMFRIVLRSAGNIEGFPVLKEVLAAEIAGTRPSEG